MTRNQYEQEIRTLITEFEKLGWEFNGFDHSMFCDSFSKKYSYKYNTWKQEESTWIGISPTSISIERKHWAVDKQGFLSGMTLQSVILSAEEIEIISKMANWSKTTRLMFPKDMAKHQKELDQSYEFETGETVCTFKDGVLSCGVKSNDGK